MTRGKYTPSFWLLGMILELQLAEEQFEKRRKRSMQQLLQSSGWSEKQLD
jgi:hypothetical protein